MKKFKGFTLTELMIALTVIGILTAIVTPTVMRIKPNKNKMMTKKAYYTAENIINSLINNTNYYPDKSDDTTNVILGFDETSAVALPAGSVSGNEKFAKLFAYKLNIKGTPATVTKNSTTFYKCVTTDGMVWYLPYTLFDNDAVTKVGNTTLYVDVNGETNDPNCRQTGKDFGGDTCEGSADDFDQFGIWVQEDGKMHIADDDAKSADYITIDAKVSGSN